MPILLDLFSGSLSWTKSFAELPDWETISIDNDPKYTDTTIIIDVLEWEVPERLHGADDVVTIGVPCQAFSTANKKKRGKRKKPPGCYGDVPSNLPTLC